MSRHINDQRAPAGEEKRRAFYALARRDLGPHPAVMALLRRPRPEARREGREAFARIERGRTA